MELTSPRFAELLELTDRYNQMMGGYEVADLLAAGFSPAEIDAFETERRLDQPLDPSAQTFLENRDPTRRERHTAALARRAGGDDFDRDDYRRAQKYTGTADPTATFVDQLGLVDLVTPGGVYAIEEGIDTFQRGRTTGDRGTMAGGGLETGLGILGLVPSAGALAKTARSGLRRTASAPAVASPDLQDPSRRRFLAAATAAGATPLLPAEEFLAAGTRAATRTQSLGPLLSKLKQHNAQERALSESLRPLDREIAAAGRRDLPGLLMTPEQAQAIEAADEAMVQRREIISTLAGNTEGRKGVVEDLTNLLTENADALDELDPEAAPQVFENLIERVSQRQGMAGALDAQIDVMDALEEGPKALEELGLTQPEANLAVRLGPTISELYK